jgi:hypothetical protein
MLSNYKLVGNMFVLEWRDGIPRQTFLDYDPANNRAVITIKSLGLSGKWTTSSGVYSLSDFMPGMMAVSLGTHIGQLCPEPRFGSESCERMMTDLSTALSFRSLRLTFPYPKEIELDSEDAVKCRIPESYTDTFAMLFLGDVESDISFGSTSATSAAQTHDVCAVLASS